jgi:hypothetical protein
MGCRCGFYSFSFRCSKIMTTMTLRDECLLLALKAKYNFTHEEVLELLECVKPINDAIIERLGPPTGTRIN